MLLRVIEELQVGAQPPIGLGAVTAGVDEQGFGHPPAAGSCRRRPDVADLARVGLGGARCYRGSTDDRDGEPDHEPDDQAQCQDRFLFGASVRCGRRRGRLHDGGRTTRSPLASSTDSRAGATSTNCCRPRWRYRRRRFGASSVTLMRSSTVSTRALRHYPGRRFLTVSSRPRSSIRAGARSRYRRSARRSSPGPRRTQTLAPAPPSRVSSRARRRAPSSRHVGDDMSDHRDAEEEARSPRPRRPRLANVVAGGEVLLERVGSYAVACRANTTFGLLQHSGLRSWLRRWARSIVASGGVRSADATARWVGDRIVTRP